MQKSSIKNWQTIQKMTKTRKFLKRINKIPLARIIKKEKIQVNIRNEKGSITDAYKYKKTSETIMNTSLYTN